MTFDYCVYTYSYLLIYLLSYLLITDQFFLLITIYDSCVK